MRNVAVAGDLPSKLRERELSARCGERSPEVACEMKNAGQPPEDLGHIGATLRDATRFITEEALPDAMNAMLVLLELAEADAADKRASPLHWTSDREPEKPESEKP
jgi:hypothetical protein